MALVQDTRMWGVLFPSSNTVSRVMHLKEDQGTEEQPWSKTHCVGMERGLAVRAACILFLQKT